MRILVIEDDETLAGGIRRALDASGYRTDVALDGATGLEMGDGNIVEVYVRHLRNKLERPFGRTVIETVRGAGYRFSVQGERD